LTFLAPDNNKLPTFMGDVEERIGSLDVSLFDGVSSQTYPEDRKSLLLLQRCLRQSGSYIYLEIGSHLGGTLQPHLVDDRCKLIYSIDKRPLEQPDESSCACYYPGNSTAQMLAGLGAAYPKSSIEKIRTFDADARELDPDTFTEKPDFCFIDAEHTDIAVASDFDFCLRVCNPNAIIGFHDANVIVGGLARIKRRLASSKVPFAGFVLPRHVYVILLSEAVERWGPEISEAARDEWRYLAEARWALFKTRFSRRYPALQKLWHAGKRLISKTEKNGG
jgi:Methyltransferase domain